MKIILLLLLTFCNHFRSNHQFLFSSFFDNPVHLFWYGEKDIAVVYPPETNPNTKLVLWKDKLCLYSHTRYFFEREYGIKFRLCFDNSDTVQKLLNDSLSVLAKETDSLQRPTGFIPTEQENIELKFLKLSEVKNEIKSNKILHVVVGDNQIKKEIVAIKSYSLNWIQLEKVFPAPSSSIIVYEDKLEIYIPNKLENRSGTEYLVLSGIKNGNWYNKISAYLLSFQNKNKELVESCKDSTLEITEVMGKSHPYSGRFMEIYNPSENINCTGELNFTINGNLYIVPNPAKFYFPKAIQLLTDENSILDGTNIPEIDWKTIGNSETVSIQKNNFTSSIYLKGKGGYSSSEEFYSSLNNSYGKCEAKTKLYDWKNLCADPGLYLSPSDYQTCNANDFTLTEFNPKGILIVDDLDYRDKFIELQYNGNTECNTSGIFLVVDNEEIPFSSYKVYAKNLILVGRGKWISNFSYIIKRDLSSLQENSKVTLSDGTNNKELNTYNQENQVIGYYDSDGKLHSSIFQESQLQLHNTYKSPKLNSSVMDWNSMSPGELLKPIGVESAILNEVSWNGSYSSISSYPEDKFIEIQSKGEGTIQLRVQTDLQTKNYFFSVLEKDNLSVLAKQKLECFPSIPVIKIPEFSISSSKTKLSILLKGKEVSSLEYSGSISGIEDTTSKIRKSYSYTGYKDLWKTSKEVLDLSNICFSNTAASPKKENNFYPEIKIESNTKEKLNYSIVQSQYDFSNSISFRLYIYQPVQERKLNLNANLRIDSGSIDWLGIEKDSLVYGQIETNKDLHSYANSQLYIDSIFPNPSSNVSDEWIRVCNRSEHPVDTSFWEMEDSSTTSDWIVPAIQRIDSSKFNANSFLWNQSILSPNSCAYILDPNIINFDSIQQTTNQTTLLTVKTINSIGNGISSTDTIDLYTNINGYRQHIASYGNKKSHNSFFITIPSNSILQLILGRIGEKSEDYEVAPWVK